MIPCSSTSPRSPWWRNIVLPRRWTEHFEERFKESDWLYDQGLEAVELRHVRTGAQFGCDKWLLPWGRSQIELILLAPTHLMSPANCFIKHGFHLTCYHLQIRQKLLPAAGEAALAGAKLQAGRGGRQWHDQDQRPRHQGRLQVSQIMENTFCKFHGPFSSGTRRCWTSSPTYSNVSSPTEVQFKPLLYHCRPLGQLLTYFPLSPLTFYSVFNW